MIRGFLCRNGKLAHGIAMAFIEAHVWETLLQVHRVDWKAVHEWLHEIFIASVSYKVSIAQPRIRKGVSIAPRTCESFTVTSFEKPAQRRKFPDLLPYLSMFENVDLSFESNQSIYWDSRYRYPTLSSLLFSFAIIAAAAATTVDPKYQA